MREIDEIWARCARAITLIDDVVHGDCNYATYCALIESAQDIPYLLDDNARLDADNAAKDARIAELEALVKEYAGDREDACAVNARRASVIERLEKERDAMLYAISSRKVDCTACKHDGAGDGACNVCWSGEYEFEFCGLDELVQRVEKEEG